MMNEMLSTIVSRIQASAPKAPKVGANKNSNAQQQIEDVVGIIINSIEYFNSLPADIVTLDGIKIEEIYVIDEFKDLVMPASVKVDPLDFNCQELLVRPQSDYVFSREEFINAQLTFRMWFNTNMKDDVSTLDQLRKKVSFSDVVDRAAYPVNGEYVCNVYGRMPFIPICLNYGAGFYKSSYYNITADELIKEYFIRFLV